jgi:hypothetical protein
MKNKLSLVQKHGQWYARWKSTQKHRDAKGKFVGRHWFAPTGVAVEPPDASSKKKQQAFDLAMKVSCHLKELTSHNALPITVQAKLKTFALQ